MNIVEIKTNTHLVVKNKDIKDAISEREERKLYKILGKVNKFRDGKGKPNNDYIVCNWDEPYAKDVYDVIMNGELRKAGE